MARTPDEILTVLDQAQERLDPEQFDLRSLLWEVIEDLLDSLGGYARWEFADETPFAVVNECKAMLTDYVTNHYGDD